MFIRIGYFIFIVACWQPTVLFAQSSVMGDCDMPSKTCLKFVNEELEKVKPHSMQWYSLKLLQLDSLITIKEFKLLQQALNSLNNNTPHPPMFLTHLNIYRAKLLLIDGSQQQAKALLKVSVDELKQLNQSFYSPIRMISIANLMQNLKQHTEALTLLERIEQDFENSRDSYLKLELYGNLGHVHRLLKNYDQALGYYKKSLLFAIDIGVEQQIHVLHEHVGNMYMATKQYALAESSYKDALTYAEKDARVATITEAKITLAFFYLRQMELPKAEALTKDIEPEEIQPHQKNKWQVINDALNQGNQ